MSKVLFPLNTINVDKIGWIFLIYKNHRLPFHNKCIVIFNTYLFLSHILYLINK